ncbi:mechanosensitive ion channel protein MscS [Endozoicomonas sp. OPT23]|uniref:mechanosensitive ion channel family protein n=1 Tax=Endozoicomonas sp. OPT23 TaxID=2072845 RepID=UPI00129A0D34|nr:mechanosensitive ion channel family protein [Endozoicomonas sp. OPT23]MRI32607.1 mechanosensitive ion channel protein MscS [Endozoicomonas sp. OPT23]
MIVLELDKLIQANQWLSTVAVTGCILLVRIMWQKLLRRSKRMDNETRRNFSNSLRNFSHLLIAVLLIAIWLPEIRHFALSIAAFIAALVLATREFIQCLTGSLYHISTKPYAVGDWVQIGNNYGEVLAIHMLSTKLYEVDIAHGNYGFTGKTLTVPNSLLVTSIVKNLNFTRRFAYHSFSITREAEDVNLYILKDRLMQRVKESCEHFREVGRRYNEMLENRLDIAIPGPDPAIHISSSELGKNVVTIGIFCPTEEVEEMEQKITEEFMKIWYALREQVLEAQAIGLKESGLQR